MNIQEEHSRRVTFDMTDRLEQKIDKLTVMMGKLVMKDDRQNRQLNCEFIKPIEVEDKQDTITNSKVFQTDLGQIIAGAIHLEEGQHMDKIIEVGQGLIQIIEVITETI